MIPSVIFICSTFFLVSSRHITIYTGPYIITFVVFIRLKSGLCHITDTLRMFPKNQDPENLIYALRQSSGPSGSEAILIISPTTTYGGQSISRLSGHRKTCIMFSIAHPPALCKTGRCNLERLEGGSKVNHNIGNHDFWLNLPKRYRPQDAVVLNNEQNGKCNHARMRY